MAALFWREASQRGATAAIAAGFVLWAWTSFMPSFETSSPLVASLMAEGPWGIGWLRPQALFGLEGIDPLVHAVFWSLLLNTATLVVVSLLSSPSALERVQAALFMDLFRGSASSSPSVIRGSATARDLRFVAERVFGGLPYDAFLVEWDDEGRDGGYAPVRHLRRGSVMVMGLISSKTPKLEDEDALVRRMEEAAGYAGGMERLAISPQCGFASVMVGNETNEDAQWRKLELVGRVADRLWL